MEAMAGERRCRDHSFCQQVTDRPFCPAPPTHPHTHTHIYIHPHTPPLYLRRHSAFTGKNQISSSVSHYVIHLSARRKWRPQQENNDQPRIFIKAGLDFSFLTDRLIKIISSSANYKHCAVEVGSTGVSFEQLNYH